MGKLGDFKSRDPCCVPQCKSRCTNEVSLFLFPKDEALRKTWADAIRIEKTITNDMQVCSRHFVKNDYILPDLPGIRKVRRLKKSAVPSQNLPWQFPNKRVSPALAKARMERLKKRTQLKTSSTAEHDTDASTISEPDSVKASPDIKDEMSDDESADEKPLKSSDLTEQEKSADIKESENEIANKNSVERSPDEASEAKIGENNMRSRAPTRLRQLKSVLKCELCGRKCLTPQALRSHQQNAHKTAKNEYSSPEKKSPTMNKAKEPAKVAPRAFISVKQPEQLVSPKLFPKDVPKVDRNELLLEQVIRDFDSDGAGSTDYSSDESAKKEQLKPEKRDRRKTEFECPKCKKRFAVYFSAVQHIQKHHSAPLQGDKVRTPSVLKPNRVEICTICSLTLTSDVHLCIGPLKLAPGFVCTGCSQEFKTLTLFDMHKSGMHSDGVESMFFPTLDEFENWKTRMEEQTESKYTVLDQNDSKKIHRCTHLARSGAGPASRAHMCPSSVIVQEFTRGFQVHYYPNHFGHDFEDYTLSSAFKKYSIASLMNVSASQPPQSPPQPPNDAEDDGEPDLYLQFKKLTELLINEAARINVNALKKLMRKALEMSAIVNSYDEDDDMMSAPSFTVDSDLQDEIKKAFQSFKKSGKRKKSVDVPEPPAKKTKPVFQSTENTLKEKSQVVKKNTAVVKTKEEIENLKCDTRKEAAVNAQKNNQSPSFIDTYQEFVGKSLVKTMEVMENQKPKADKKKPVVKTRMGQFKPSPPKKESTPEPKPIVKTRMSQFKPSLPQKKSTPEPKPVVKTRMSQFKPSPKESTPELKPVVKTRMSQFKLSPSKKLSTPEPKSPARTSIGSVRDIEYEVKEQENDCNILILKI